MKKAILLLLSLLAALAAPEAPAAWELTEVVGAHFNPVEGSPATGGRIRPLLGAGAFIEVLLGPPGSFEKTVPTLGIEVGAQYLARDFRGFTFLEWQLPILVRAHWKWGKSGATDLSFALGAYFAHGMGNAFVGPAPEGAFDYTTLSLNRDEFGMLASLRWVPVEVFDGLGLGVEVRVHQGLTPREIGPLLNPRTTTLGAYGVVRYRFP